MARMVYVEDEGQEFRAGAFVVGSTRVVDGIPFAGVDLDHQMHLKELFDAAVLEAPERPETHIECTGHWATWMGYPREARLAFVVDRPRRLDLRLLFDASKHRKFLNAVVERGTALLLPEAVMADLNVATALVHVGNSLAVSVPTDGLRPALR